MEIGVGDGKVDDFPVEFWSTTCSPILKEVDELFRDAKAVPVKRSAKAIPINIPYFLSIL